MNDFGGNGAEFLASLINVFRYHKELADRAAAQVSDEQIRRPLDANTNSIAVIMKHVAGNLRSRWTDFLASDGEKAWRNRDQEFVDDYASRDELLADWESGWGVLFATLESLSPGDLGRTIHVRGEPHSVILAAHRSLAHTAYHVGQIVLFARHLAGDQWTVLTIPRGASEQFNKTHWGGKAYGVGK